MPPRKKDPEAEAAAAAEAENNPLYAAALSVGKHMVPKGAAIGGVLLELLTAFFMNLVTNGCGKNLSPVQAARRLKLANRPIFGLAVRGQMLSEALQITGGDWKKAQKMRDGLVKEAKAAPDEQIAEVVSYCRSHEATGDEPE